MDTTFASGHTNSLNTKLAKAGTTVAIIILVTLAFLSIAVSWKLSCSEKDLSPCQLDFYMFWTEARVLQKGESADLYLPSEARRLGEVYHGHAQSSGIRRLREAATLFRVLEPISTPLLFSSFSTWVSADYLHDLRLFFLVGVGCYLSSLCFLMRLYRLSDLAKAVVLVCFFFPLAPASADLQSGNVNSLQLAALCCLIALVRVNSSRARDILLGGILAGLTLFKPNIAPIPILFALHLARQGRKTELARILIGAGISAISLYLFVKCIWPSGSPWISWFNAINIRFANRFEASPIDGSLANLLANAINATIRWDRVIGSVVLGLAILAIFSMPRQTTRNRLIPSTIALRQSDTLIIYLGIAVGVLCSKPMWVHYSTLLTPAIFELIFPLYPCRKALKIRITAILLTYIVLVVTVGFMIALTGARDLGTIGAWSYAFYALFILGAIMHRLHTLNLLPVAPRKKTPHPDSVCSLRKPHSSSYNLRPMVAKIGCLGRESTPRQPLICLVKGSNVPQKIRVFKVFAICERPKHASSRSSEKPCNLLPHHTLHVANCM